MKNFLSDSLKLSTDLAKKKHALSCMVNHTHRRVWIYSTQESFSWCTSHSIKLDTSSHTYLPPVRVALNFHWRMYYPAQSEGFPSSTKTKSGIWQLTCQQRSAQMCVCGTRTTITFRGSSYSCYLKYSWWNLTWHSFWGGRYERACFDVLVFNSHALSNRQGGISACYWRQEILIKKEHRQSVREIEHESFTPLVLSATGACLWKLQTSCLINGYKLGPDILSDHVMAA